MIADPEANEEDKIPAATKPGWLELFLIFVFLLFVGWGTYEFGIYLINQGTF